MRHLSFSKNLIMWPLSFSKNRIMRPSTEGQFLKTKSQKVAYFDRQISKFFCVWFIWDNSRSKPKQIRICVIDSLLNNFVDNKVEKSNKKCENYLDIIWLPELGTRKLFNFATTTTRQLNKASENTKYEKF